MHLLLFLIHSALSAQKPEVILIDPIPRADTPSKLFDQSPCSGVAKGPSHSIVDPDSFHPVSWFTVHASESGNCTVRLLSPDSSFITLKAKNIKNEANGWFPCARKESLYETVSVYVPKDVNCPDCSIQLILKTFQGSSYQCADILITGGVKQTCVDKCKNKGVCDGNLCVCNEGFYGSFCEFKVKGDAEGGGIGLVVLFFLLLVVASTLVAVLMYWKYPEKIPKRLLEIMQGLGKKEEIDRSEEIEESRKNEHIAVNIKKQKHSSSSSDS